MKDLICYKTSSDKTLRVKATKFYTTLESGTYVGFDEEECTLYCGREQLLYTESEFTSDIKYCNFEMLTTEDYYWKHQDYLTQIYGNIPVILDLTNQTSHNGSCKTVTSPNGVAVNIFKG